LKLTVIGFGQCGGRIADKFVILNRKAKQHKNIEIIPSTIAVNTDAADLSGLRHIAHDFRHRIIVGERVTHGHGIGKINELAADIIRQDADRIFHAIRSAERALESDAFLLVASTSGGTGSGSISAMTNILKERYIRRPVYALVVLPFEQEKLTQERAVYNTGRCLKTVISVADAVFLVDNQRYIGKGLSLNNSLDEINEIIAGSFFDMLCSGEERNKRRIGAKTMDTGDIMATLKGWSIIGCGRTPLSAFNLPFFNSHFVKQSNRNQRGLKTLDEALSDLSCECQFQDVGRSFYLISGPSRELGTDLDFEVSEALRELMPQATIRNGDYPTERASLGVNIMLSDLANVEKVREYYSQSAALMSAFEQRASMNQVRLREMEEEAKSLPNLL
jgi:cell division GTPase FtsZ